MSDVAVEYGNDKARCTNADNSNETESKALPPASCLPPTPWGVWLPAAHDGGVGVGVPGC
jgi:hypothetical protein